MSDELKTFIGEKMGEATMCWEPIPSGVFDSQRAVKILDEIYEAIEAEQESAITAHYIPKEAVASAIPKRREQLIDMAGRLYEPEWLQGYNQAINEIRSALKLDDKEE